MMISQIFVFLSCLTSSQSTSIRQKSYRLRQVLIVHRHGDRTPITPLHDESYWQSTLPPSQALHAISKGTKLKRGSNDDDNNKEKEHHGALGRGPFGQLTLLGLLQMIHLGERLREELLLSESNHPQDSLRLFSHDRQLHPRRVRVVSTDFPRTIQSVQALLTGLFPGGSKQEEEDDSPPIEMNVQNTNSYLIPDPQPRQSPLQTELEHHFCHGQPHLLQREVELKPLAVRISTELQNYCLAEGAKHMGVSFGIGEDVENKNDSNNPQNVSVLPWAQMSDILTCLHARKLLPASISEEDVHTVSSHVAWRWFESLRHPILSKAAMWKLTNELIESMERKVKVKCQCEACVEQQYLEELPDLKKANKCIDEPWMHIYSAHDSTLIGLLCLLQLEKPTEWPDYGSFLKLELICEDVENEGTVAGEVDHEKWMKEVEEGITIQQQPLGKQHHWVRFSLNGQTLKSTWFLDKNNQPASMVPLKDLVEMIHSEHEVTITTHDQTVSPSRFIWKNGLLQKHKNS